MKAIFSGDLHLGRRSSRLGSTLDSRQADAAHAWGRMVDVAIQNRVDLVLLSGDVVDQHNRFYEAVGPLERGLGRLRQAGIRTMAVAGNHDYEVLARLAGNLDPDSFKLLGADGRWQRETIRIDGRPVLALDGWSFTSQYVESSPLEAYAPPTDGNIPTLVMVHGELDNPGSRYAPLDRQRMLGTAVAGWLLGHIHAPRNDRQPGRPCILNPGSPQALDPGETGVHGPWLIEVAPGGPPAYRQLPLSTVRYENVRVTLEEAADRAAVDSRIWGAIRDARAKASDDSAPELRHLAIRLTIGGSVAPALIQELPKIADELRQQDHDLGSAECSVGLEQVELDVRPTIDLKSLAKERSAAAEIARLILALDAGGPLPAHYDKLVRQAAETLQNVHAHRDFTAIAGDVPPAAEDCRGILRRQASELLGALLAGGEAE